MPLTGYNTSSIDGIEKSKTSARECFLLKFPKKIISEVEQRFTCPLDIKYPIFVKKGDFEKAGTLNDKEVSSLFLVNFLFKYFS